MFKFASRLRFKPASVGARRAFSVGTFKPFTQPRIAVPVSFAFTGLTLYSICNTIALDNSQNDNDTVSVDSSIDPFPIKLAKPLPVNKEYTLIGHGVRSVTFVGFKVYGIGLYIANEDIEKARKILRNEQFLKSLETPEEDLNARLSSPTDSVTIVEKLIDANVKFTAVICPVRNTDFNHLKDGLVKSILSHPKSKEDRETLGQGLEELRSLFMARKGSVPKNHLMYLEVLNGGKLNVTYYDKSKNNVVSLGQVNEPLVSKILFLQYLSGKKPLSEPLRKSCVDGLIAL